MNEALSLFDRYASRPRWPWLNFGVVALCAALPLAVARWEGGLATPLQVRTVLTPSAIIAYILIIAPRLAIMEARVRDSIELLQAEASRDVDREGGSFRTPNPAWEIVAFAAGVLFSLLFGPSALLQNFSWTGLTLVLAGGLMYGLMGVVIYGAINSTRAIDWLLKHRLSVDPLNVTPFEAVGRQSLALSLAFVGGITLSLLLSWVSAEVLRYWQFWAIYTPLTGITIIIFFLNMLPIHRLLRSARDAELRRVDGWLREGYAALVGEMEQGQDTRATAQRLSALSAYEARLQQARTWPYNTAMVRTVFVSVLVPGGTILGRLVLEAISR